MRNKPLRIIVGVLSLAIVSFVFLMTGFFGCGNSEVASGSDVMDISGTDIVSDANNDGDDENIASEPLVDVTPTNIKESFDIVLLLDKSTSMYSEIKLRNDAARTLLWTLPTDCSLGTLFFAETVDVNYSAPKELLHLSLPSNISRLLDEFKRVDVSDGGTNLLKALNEGVEMFDANSEKQKAIVLVTDGVNYVANGSGTPVQPDTTNLNHALRTRVEELATYDNGKPVPIYVFYLNAEYTGSEKDVNDLNTMLECFGNGINEAAYLDMTTYSEQNELEWNKLEWDNQSVNKVIHFTNSADLQQLLSKLFYSLKNIGYNTSTTTVNNQIMTFNVPNVNASRIQIVANSERPFSVTGIYPLDSGLADSVSGRIDCGTTHIITITPKSTDISSGSVESEGITSILSPVHNGCWQMEFEGSAPITTTVAIFSDFELECTLIQNGSETDTLECCNEATVKVRLVDSAGNELDESTSLKVFLSVNDNGTISEYTVSRKPGGTLKSEPFIITSHEKASIVAVAVYDELYYQKSIQVRLTDAPPVVRSKKLPIRYVPSELLDGLFARAASMKDIAYDSHDGVPDALSIKAVTNEIETELMVQRLNSADDYTPEYQMYDILIADEELYIRKDVVADRLLVSASDSSGNTAEGKFRISIWQKGQKLRMVGSVMAILLLCALLVFLVILIVKKRYAHRHTHQAYSVRIQRRIDGGNTVECYIPKHDNNMQPNHCDVFLRKHSFNSRFGEMIKDSQVCCPCLKLTLKKENPILTVDIRGLAMNHMLSNGFTFGLADSIDGDRCFETKSRVRLEPGLTYTVRYDGIEYTLEIKE